MTVRQTVLAVIPSYNSHVLAIERVKELNKNGIKNILICDDNSSDDSVEKVKKAVGSSVRLISGQKNLGPAGNRNRALPFLNGDEIIFFIDADCQIVYKYNLSKLIKSAFTKKDTAVVGFSIEDKKGKPMVWNYGPLMHPVDDTVDQKVQELFEAGEISKTKFKKYAPNRAEVMRILPEKQSKEVGFVAEGCMAVRSSVFIKLGGFSKVMRYHETQDFCARVKKLNGKIIFIPKLVARHLEFDSRMVSRKEDFVKGQKYYYKTHWGVNEEVFEKLFNIK